MKSTLLPLINSFLRSNVTLTLVVSILVAVTKLIRVLMLFTRSSVLVPLSTVVLMKPILSAVSPFVLRLSSESTSCKAKAFSEFAFNEKETWAFVLPFKVLKPAYSTALTFMGSELSSISLKLYSSEIWE